MGVDCSAWACVRLDSEDSVPKVGYWIVASLKVRFTPRTVNIDQRVNLSVTSGLFANRTIWIQTQFEETPWLSLQTVTNIVSSIDSRVNTLFTLLSIVLSSYITTDYKWIDTKIRQNSYKIYGVFLRWSAFLTDIVVNLTLNTYSPCLSRLHDCRHLWVEATHWE